MTSLIPIDRCRRAQKLLNGIAKWTPFERSTFYSDRYKAAVYIKREDQQVVRSYKIRGAYTKIICLPDEQPRKGVVCASAGNHAQGVAYSCNVLDVPCTIFMPKPTPPQKVRSVRKFGGSMVEVKLVGDSFDDAYKESMDFATKHHLTYVHPFDDLDVIAGQATVSLEVLDDSKSQIDYLLVPIGGGGLVSGAISVFKSLSPQTKIIGVEPAGAASMAHAFQNSAVNVLEDIDTFVDGAAVKAVGSHAYAICKEYLDHLISVPEGAICSHLINLYHEEGIVAELAGALSLAGLDEIKDEIIGKKVVCILSGGNNDLTRAEEIYERSLVAEGLKHYFLAQLPQRPGALMELLNEVVTTKGDICFLKYSKAYGSTTGSVIIGIEVEERNIIKNIVKDMELRGISLSHISQYHVNLMLRDANFEIA